MACSFSPSSATRLQAVDAAAAGVKNGRVPLKASVAPAQRSLGCCRATARKEGATQEPSVAGSEQFEDFSEEPTVGVGFEQQQSWEEVSSTRTQLDLLEQLTSPLPDGIAGQENGTPPEPRQRATIREQLSALGNGKVDEFTLPLGKKLKEGLKRLNSLTVSQRRNIKRQAMLTQVSGRNDSVFFATVGAFVLVPPFAILAIAVLTGYIQLLP